MSARFSKNLSGLNAAVFVSDAVAYTTDATISAFLANAPDGELGVYLKDGSLKSTALAAGDEFKVVQKRDGFLHQTPLLKFDDIIAKRRTDYVAPQIEKVSVGFSKAAGTGSLDLSLSTPGTQELVVAVRITTPANQPFPVEEGRAISTKTTDKEYDKVRELVNDLNNLFDYQGNQNEPLVIASIQSNGTVTEFTGIATITTVKNGSRIVTFSAAQNVPANTYVSIRDRVFQVVEGGAAVTSITLDAPYTGVSEAIDNDATVNQAGTISYTDGTTELGILIEGIDSDTHFSVSVLEDLDNATITTDQAWKLGSGDGASVIELEKEGVTFSGIGATQNAAFKDDFGYPSLFGNVSRNYDLFFIELAPEIFRSAARPVASTRMEQTVIIAAPEAGSTPTANLSTIFGL